MERIRSEGQNFFEVVAPQEEEEEEEVISVGCTMVKVPRNIPSAACAAASEDERVMLETFRGH
jgi:hypothetical protein